MQISLSGRQRTNFVNDLKAHRATSPLSDARYASEVLGVSLNTFKKCTQNKARGPLKLRRQTFISIFANTNLDPQDYGLTIVPPSRSSPYGAYQKHEFPDLCCRFLLYRRTFLSARDITCGVLDIFPSPNQQCLSFIEEHHYKAEGGIWQSLQYTGDVYINKDRTLFSLPAFEDGQVRLTQLQPERLPSGQIKLRGALLTFGSPKGIWQPTVSCVFADGPIDNEIDPKDVCRTIPGTSDEFHKLSAELEHIERFTTNIAPLMWAMNPKSGNMQTPSDFDQAIPYEQTSQDRRYS